MKTTFSIVLLLSLLACTEAGRRSSTIITVNGVGVTESEYQTQLDYELSYRDIKQEGVEIPGLLTEEELKTRIISRMLIPMAAVRARYQEKIPKLLEQGEAILKEVTPANFADMARKYSKDSTAAQGGDWRTVTRYSLFYPVTRLLFSADEGEILGPVLSHAGCHILYVEEKRKGMVPGDDTVQASHILLPYEEGRLDFIPTVINEITRAAKIEIVNPDYAPYVKIPKAE
jgi:parvulin-like peptidyl-prolyl isomerase